MYIISFCMWPVSMVSCICPYSTGSVHKIVSFRNACMGKGGRRPGGVAIIGISMLTIDFDTSLFCEFAFTQC